MNKELLLKIVGISIGMLVLSFLFQTCLMSVTDSMIQEETTTIIDTTEESIDYNLEKAPLVQGVDKSKKAKEEYFEYLKQHIRPIELRDFIKERDMETDLYDDTGNKMINWLVAMAYMNMFESIFDTNRINFDDCPVTNRFLQKFNTNLVEYFDIKFDELWVNTSTVKQVIKVEARWNNALDGEAEYSELYRFKYTLDEEGNVDDIILEHVGWD